MFEITNLQVLHDARSYKR